VRIGGGALEILEINVGVLRCSMTRHRHAAVVICWSVLHTCLAQTIPCVMYMQGLQAYKDTDFKQYWMPDSVSKECYDCGEKFTTFRRRHHCRVCGQIFCSRCCNQEIPGKIMGCTGTHSINCALCCIFIYCSFAWMRKLRMKIDQEFDENRVRRGK